MVCKYVHKKHSRNLCKTFVCVKNKEAGFKAARTDHELSGVLRYVKSNEDVLPGGTY